MEELQKNWYVKAIAIAIESLGVKGMMANRKLARAISDCGWGELVRQLEYKCDWHDRTLVKIDRFFPSSKPCNSCGYKIKKLPLSVREWKCDGCGNLNMRERNAAKNILGAGLALIARGATNDGVSSICEDTLPGVPLSEGVPQGDTFGYDVRVDDASYVATKRESPSFNLSKAQA